MNAIADWLPQPVTLIGIVGAACIAVATYQTAQTAPPPRPPISFIENLTIMLRVYSHPLAIAGVPLLGVWLLAAVVRVDRFY